MEFQISWFRWCGGFLGWFGSLRRERCMCNLEWRLMNFVQEIESETLICYLLHVTCEHIIISHDLSSIVVTGPFMSSQVLVSSSCMSDTVLATNMFSSPLCRSNMKTCSQTVKICRKCRSCRHVDSHLRCDGVLCICPFWIVAYDVCTLWLYHLSLEGWQKAVGREYQLLDGSSSVFVVQWLVRIVLSVVYSSGEDKRSRRGWILMKYHVINCSSLLACHR